MPARVDTNSFFSCSNSPYAQEYEWSSDTGNNRYVTNDRNDFLETTIKKTTTIVAVAGDTVTSPCSGTEISKSLDHGCTVTCLNVLLLFQCSKKLIPASPFIQKSCSLLLNDYNKISLTAKDGALILSGKEIGGLYYYRCITVQNFHHQTPPSQCTT
jgi:hypothetical protein